MDAVAPGIAELPLRTPTLPPATHTNTWLLGHDELVVVDPASPYDDEQGVLASTLDALEADGRPVAALFLTHHHADHVGGVLALRDHLARRGRRVPLVAHEVTAALLPGLGIDTFWTEGEVHDIAGLRLEVLHTPGHAPGHLCLRDLASGMIVAGDMVAGVGTIAIDPDEGDLGDYLHHLERLRALSPTALLPAHGPVLHQADAVLTTYVSHRHMRSEQIRAALVDHGVQTPIELVAHVYPELDGGFRHLASRQILTHLHWMRGHGLATERRGGWGAE
jgi:glyoxylase-like metal-dependent hydrolase (beta-lactamase superfamily II)